MLCVIVSFAAVADAPLPGGGLPGGQQLGLLSGTRIEIGARTYDFETQLMRILADLDGGASLYARIADEEGVYPIVGISSQNLLAGPILLNGLHRAVRSPTGHGPGSSAWSETTKLRPDFSFEPSSRRGLELSYQSASSAPGFGTRFSIYSLEERTVVPGAGVSVSHSSDPYTFEALSGVTRPERRSTPDDWFLSRQDFPGEHLAHSAVSAGLKAAVLDAQAAGGVSYGPLVRPGGWGRGLVSLRGQTALLQLLGAVSNPDYRAPDGRRETLRRYTDVSLRIPGEGVFTVFGGVASRFGQAPFSVHEAATHQREFRFGFDFAGARVRLGLTVTVENERGADNERARNESVRTRIQSGAFTGDGLRGTAEYRLVRRYTADAAEPEYLTVSQVGLQYRVQALRIELNASHEIDLVNRFSVRGASYVSHGDWAFSVLLSNALSPSDESNIAQEWSTRLEVRRIFHSR